MQPQSISLRIRALLGIAAMALGGSALAQTRLDMAIAWPPGNFHTKNAVAFAEAVDKATGGQVKITVHAGGVLGLKGPEALRAVRDGIVPMAEFNAPQQVGDAPLFALETQPYLVGDYRQLRVLHDIMLPEYDKVLARFGQKRLYMTPWPDQYLFTRKPVASTPDVKGMKVRVTDRVTSELIKHVGMSPVQMTFADMMPALASGGLDGVTTSASTAVDSRFWEFLKHAYKTNHVWSSNVATINLAAWKKLTAAQRDAIEKVARDLEPAFWKASQEDDAKSLAVLREHGMQVEPLPAPVTADLKQAAAGMVEDYARRTPSVPELLRQYRERAGQAR
ncbi:C4-dicarboxylate ABC transporter substrate-binding protein [Pigmentiphaga sp. H8]|uniref:TRAP transporter substrate-binding protein n=1 Tax=Pigmentiphaga sp. H8 TaxID=2488560 RepID=UPI000F5B82C4|nr:TRAP transporter substrate-binding protein [Pigmentiphaga sp. H8]AZG06793.1 C4-dicarboxylate ABC transporter substrate-binding protein [Pigmentiphaga sp. H8]